MSGTRFIAHLLVFTHLFMLGMSSAQGQVVFRDRVDTSVTRPAPVPIDEPGRDDAMAPPAEQPAQPPPRRVEPVKRPLRPFGTNLFTGGFLGEREDGLNPEYIVSPGDRITLRIWGATTFEGVTIVDAQGNIFVPDVGPIRVAGVANKDLNKTVEIALQRTFTSNVNVYTNLEGTSPVVVFVTGFVKSPGSYVGTASDSPMFFLSRAGGIDPQRGSFRQVQIKRDGRTIHNLDLYRFILDGEMPRVQFRDRDTIVVDRRGNTVSVDGAVRNAFVFEIPETGISGTDLMKLARPEPAASHVTLTGPRPEGPFSTYRTLTQLRAMVLQDGDEVVFEEDRHEATMLVSVEGSHLGPSRFAVPTDAKLVDLLDHIEIDPRLADISAISLRRVSIAKRQKQALDESLSRLEMEVLSASSQTDAEAAIRAREAVLIRDFITRARQLEPEGVLVVADKGSIANVKLEPNDVVTIPEQSNVVLVSGEVMVPQALLHEPVLQLDDYINRVGGLTKRANTQRFLVVRRNGAVIQQDTRSRQNWIIIEPGDEIIVLPKAPTKNLQLAATITQIIFQGMLSVATVLGARN